MMLTMPEPMSMMSMGMRKGFTRLTPRSRSTLCCVSRVPIPPMPEPMTTPTRSAFSGVICRTRVLDGLESRDHGVLVVNRSMRRASLEEKRGVGSNPFTSAAMRVGKVLASNFVIGPAPDRPAFNPSQYSERVLPSGVMAPMPVMTTRRVLVTNMHLPREPTHIGPARGFS